MKIKNPEKECEKTPKNFSQESKIEGIKLKDDYWGIVLDDFEDLKNALKVYDERSIGQSKETNVRQATSLLESHGLEGVGLFTAASEEARKRNNIVEFILSEAGNLRDGQTFNRHFDYDGMGTNFFKTTVIIDRVGNFYLLKLNASYVGDEPEDELAKALSKRRGLTNSRILARFSVVDDWWFNINLEEIIERLPIEEKRISEWHKKRWRMGNPSEEIANKFTHNGRKFSLDIDLNSYEGLLPKGKYYGQGHEYLEVRGKHLVGGAWVSPHTYFEEPEVKWSPSFSFDVSLPFDKKEEYMGCILSKGKIERIRSARDYIARLIMPETENSVN